MSFSVVKAILVVAFLNLNFLTLAHAAPADTQAGQSKSQLCAACHGAYGISSIPGVPHLAAQPSLSIVYQLIQFKNKGRVGGGMEGIAATLTDQDMKDIAAYYFSLPANKGVQVDVNKVAQGQKIAAQQFCQSCHAGQLQGQKHVPRIAGQAPDYLKVQLKKLRSGERADMDGTMASAAKGLTDEDIEAIVAYAQSLN